jgi:hypothetical protein
MICAIWPGRELAGVVWTRHMTMKKSAANPFEVNHLCPLMTH